jgi:hypothetical protein
VNNYSDKGNRQNPVTYKELKQVIGFLECTTPKVHMGIARQRFANKSGAYKQGHLPDQSIGDTITRYVERAYECTT